MSSTKLEIRVEKKRTRYIATCATFPTCRGIGLDEKDALGKLSRSISQHVASVVNNNLSSLFASDDYTEKISPVPRPGDVSVSKRVYKLHNADLPAGVQQAPASKTPEIPTITPQDLLEDSMSALIDEINDAVLFEEGSLITKKMNKRNHSDDDVFGILMSLN